MPADSSDVLRVLIIGDVPGVEWLKVRLAHLVPPADVNRAPSLEQITEQDVFHLVVAQSAFTSMAIQRWPAALVCESAEVEDGSIRLVAVDPRQAPLVHVVEKYLYACPNNMMQRLAEQMRLVNEVSREIAEIHDLEEILNLIPDRLTETFGYYHAAIGTIDVDAIEMYESSQSSRAVGPERFRIALDGPGMVPWVARAGVTRLSNDTLTDEVWIPGKGLEASRSELTVPLVYHDRVIGLIDVQSQHTGAFDQDDLSVLEALAGQLAVTIENARLLDESGRKRGLAEALSHISRLANAMLDVQQVSHTVLRELERLIEYDTALIALFENNTFEVVHQAGYGTNDAPHLQWLLKESPILYRVVNQQAPVWFGDTSKNRLWQKAAREQPTRSWLGVPLLSRDQPIGVLAVARIVPNAYQQADADILFALANQIASVIDNAQILEQSEQREREARALYEITHLLVTLDHSAIPASLLRHLGEALAFDAAAILVVAEVGHIATSARREVAEPVIVELEDRLIRAFNALSREPINPAAIRRQILLHGALPEGKPIEHLSAYLSAPLLVGRHVVGVIELGKADPVPYTETQLRTLYTIANSVASALENARLYQELMSRAINLQQAVDELAAADRLKDELIGNVSHELRSPLTYIMGYVDLLVAGEMGELQPEQQSSLEIVAAKTRKLARLVSDILALEKSQTDDLQLAPANLAEIAQQAIQEISHSAAEAGIEITTEFHPDAGPVLVDAGRVEQVFINLLGNALKFSPAGGTLSVRIAARGQQVRAEVADTGIGIPEDKQARIFDRFYQVDIESRRHYGSVGLGLAICKQIIEAHGGRIGVISTLGVGSTFYFELPAISPPDRSTDVDGAEDGAGLHT